MGKAIAFAAYTSAFEGVTAWCQSGAFVPTRGAPVGRREGAQVLQFGLHAYRSGIMRRTSSQRWHDVGRAVWHSLTGIIRKFRAVEVENEFSGRAKWTAFAVGVLSIAVVGWLDWLTGNKIGFTIFYLVPVSLVGWVAGKWRAWITSVLAGFTWYSANLTGDDTYSHPAIPVWNAVMRGLMFAIVASLLPRLRGALRDVKAAASTITQNMIERRRLEEELLDVGERERQRLGRDLHDGLGQHLAGLELLCRALRNRLESGHIAEARAAEEIAVQIQQAREQTRVLARGLVPVMSSPDGLMQALDDLAATSSKLLRVECTFCCEQPALVTDHTVAVHLYRIAQEAVTNAVRHGLARRIELSLVRRSAMLALEVRDNGSGLPPDYRRCSGMGLRTMEYRSRMAGGTLRIESATPRGTVVICRVPLRPAASQQS